MLGTGTIGLRLATPRRGQPAMFTGVVLLAALGATGLQAPFACGRDARAGLLSAAAPAIRQAVQRSNGPAGRLPGPRPDRRARAAGRAHARRPRRGRRAGRAARRLARAAAAPSRSGERAATSGTRSRRTSAASSPIRPPTTAASWSDSSPRQADFLIESLGPGVARRPRPRLAGPARAEPGAGLRHASPRSATTARRPATPTRTSSSGRPAARCSPTGTATGRRCGSACRRRSSTPPPTSPGACCIAHHARVRTGRGQLVDVSAQAASA